MADKFNGWQIAILLIYLGAPAGMLAGALYYQAGLTGITGGIKNLSAILFGIGIGCLINAQMIKMIIKSNKKAEEDDKKISQN